MVCEASHVVLSRIELHWRDASGFPHALSIPIAAGATSASGERADAMVSARIERAGDETIVRGTIANRGNEPLRLDSVVIRIATGLPADRPARFFKHGYQSWSASGPAQVGATSPYPRDSAPTLIRLIHQSEVTRPENAPEAATSELFTVVENGARSERILAGFIGAASQLTVVSVTTAAEMAARAMFDGVTLAPGAEREIEPLLLISGSHSAARLAARWAAHAGRAMGARVGAHYQRGWCSWYHYFHAISEDALRANLSALAAMRAEFPLEVVQLDDGFQSALGDWDTTNARFPSGLERIAGEIRAAGFEAGIWTAPFLAARDSRIMSEHPDWFIRYSEGRLLRAGYNTNWTSHQDAFAYALDPSNPAFRAHLTRLFEKLTGFGYSYLKLDFLYAAAAEGMRHDPEATRAETLRSGLEAIRAGAGTRAFILGCGCPLGPAIGIVDGMRIGPDVAPTWGSGGAEFG
ncbi:MAG: glycoside hydrolase family 36 protein, partial [Candidatus Binataceae bacterium]